MLHIFAVCDSSSFFFFLFLFLSFRALMEFNFLFFFFLLDCINLLQAKVWVNKWNLGPLAFPVSSSSYCSLKGAWSLYLFEDSLWTSFHNSNQRLELLVYFNISVLGFMKPTFHAPVRGHETSSILCMVVIGESEYIIFVCK